MEDEGSNKKNMVDILHPLSHVKWDRRGSLPVTLPESIQVIQVNDCLCVGTEYTVYLSSADLKSWKTMVTRAHDFALTCYDSKILTIGGLDSACAREITGKSWVIDVTAQTYEPSSLPALMVARHSACAVNVESANCLVVAGGANDKEVLDSVEVLLNGKWNFMQPLPTPEFGLRVVVHDRVLYFTRNSLPSVYACEVADILGVCKTSDSENVDSVRLWKVFSSSQRHKTPVSFGNHLCMVGSEKDSSTAEIQVMSECTPDRKWVVVAEAPCPVMNRSSVILSNGNLLMVERESSNIYRGVLHMASFSSSGKFSEHALSKLEKQGIPVLKAIEKKLDRVREVLQLVEDEEQEDGDGDDDRMSVVAADNGHVGTVLKSWMSGKGSHPPTWRSLLELLRNVKEEKLSQQIESYFQVSGTTNSSRGSKRPRSLAASKIMPSPCRSSSRIRESLSSHEKEELPSSRRKMPMLKIRELPSNPRKKKALTSKEKKFVSSEGREQELSHNDDRSFCQEKQQPFSQCSEKELSQEKEEPMSQGEDQTDNPPYFLGHQNLAVTLEQEHQPILQEQPLLQENQQPSLLLKKWTLSQEKELPAAVVKKRPLSQENEQPSSIKKRPSSKKMEQSLSQQTEPPSARKTRLPPLLQTKEPKDMAGPSPAATPRRSARVRSRPDRYGTPLHS